MSNVLSRLAIEIVGNTSQFAKSMQSAEKNLDGLTKGIKGIAATVGIAFGVREVASFAFEVSKLAGEADGVQKAFDKLPNSIALMGQLKTATAGTVSELDLMKRSVQAQNFGISLGALPKLLEFASVRAQQTGQSVDYLVDSIVTGIGRKSPLILDNLGISAVALKDKMNGVSIATADVGQVAEAVGKIAEENLRTMGSMAETTAIKTQRLAASWDDVKVALGRAANESSFVSRTLNGLTNTLNAFSGDEFTTGLNQLTASMGSNAQILEDFVKAGGKIDLSWQELMARGFFRNEEAAKKYEKKLKDIQTGTQNMKLANEAVSAMDFSGGTPWEGRVDDIKKETDSLAKLRKSLDGLNKDFEKLAITDQNALQVKGQEIIAIGKQIEALEKLRKARKDEADALQMQTKFGRDVLNKEADAIGINRIDPDRFGLLSEQPKGLKEMFPSEIPAPDGSKYIETMDAIIAKTGEYGAYFESNAAQAIASQAKIDDALANTRSMYVDLGQAISSSINQSINANEKFADAMKRITKTIVSTMLARALSNAIAKAYESSKNPIVGTILAGAASAAVMALFAKIPGGSSGGGAPARVSVSSGSVERFQPKSGEQITLTGDFKADGRELALVLNQVNKDRTRGG